MFTVKAMHVPGSGNGTFATGSAPYWHWRCLVGPDTPLGGGYPDTRWYEVDEFSWDCWEDAACYIGSFVWTDQANENDDDLARGEALLRYYGYELAPSLAEVRPVTE